MARYFFHISGSHPFQDGQGVEHPDDERAWREAMRLMRDVELNLRPEGTWGLAVREGDRLVYQIHVTAKKVDLPPGSGSI
jgi:hypothetical protein